jgi:hypothetical protein
LLKLGAGVTGAGLDAQAPKLNAPAAMANAATILMNFIVIFPPPFFASCDALI